jgi:phage shock protein A
MAMGIFTRVRRLLRANINEALDRAEDPAKMLNYLILEMQEGLEQARNETARYVALLNGREAQIESLKGSLAEKEAMIGDAGGQDGAAIAEKEAELAELRRTYAAALAEREVALGEFKRAEAELSAQAG